ncbi:MAG: uroporphyrinogen decarboxylase [Alphaproteobacteria bacterium]|nr:uroporphyrinogen decarboxylase [Alphaproteobacteria bacterium]
MNNSASEKKFLRVLAGQSSPTPPVWLMRQAGRYLPEYRETRAQAGGFLDLVYNPKLAAEVTLQPLRRFAFDAAILFSDILVIPQALGQSLRFTAGEGPQLDPITDVAGMAKLNPEKIDDTLAPIYDTVREIRSGLQREGFTDTALIGFAGAPWTIACYMAEGQGSRDYLAAKSWAYRDPVGFGALINLITDATIHYLSRQIDAGAEAVQIFDSWAGAADEQQFLNYVIAPAKKIAAALRAKYPHVPLIGFPRGAGALYSTYVQQTGVTALGLDTQVPLAYARELQAHMTIQGNLDPACLLAGGAALDAGIDRILAALGQGPYIFNLGHGIIKETQPAHVEQLVKRVKGL